MKYTYLLIDLFAVIVPFIYSFHRKINFIVHIKAALGALLLVGLPFIAWDVFFTRAGVWGFNPRYLTGNYLWGLPIEEILFFFCIPYSCLFTHFVLKRYVHPPADNKYLLLLFVLAGMAMITTALLHTDQWYTLFSFGLCGTAILTALFLFRKLLYKFAFSYLVLLIPFFLVNGILTGTGLEEPVVWYNNNENLGWRVLTIPVEDFFYGFLLLISNTLVFEYLSSARHEPAQA